MFRHGLKFGFIPRGSSGGIDEYNPMKLVSAPVKTDLEAVQLSGSEAVSVIRNISDPLVKVLVILIAVTGMRISEALALSGIRSTGYVEKSTFTGNGILKPSAMESRSLG